jgi:hypothetical protein
LGQYAANYPTPSPFPVAPLNDLTRYSPYPASYPQQAYSGQFLPQQLPAEEEPRIPFIPPDLEVQTRLPFGGTANAPRPLKPALKRSSSQSTTNQPTTPNNNVNRRRSIQGGPELLGQNQDKEVRLRKIVRSDSRAPEILGDRNHGDQGRSGGNNVTVRRRSGSVGAADMKNLNLNEGNQDRLNVVTRSRSGSSGHGAVAAGLENQVRSNKNKKTMQADRLQIPPAAPGSNGRGVAEGKSGDQARSKKRPGSSRVTPAVPITVAASSSSSAPNVSPTSPTPSRSPTSSSSIPAYAQEDDQPYGANNLSGRPKDWRPDYCPTLGTSLYLKITGKRSEGEDPQTSILLFESDRYTIQYKAYEDPVKRSVHSLLEFTPQSPPLALDLRYKVKGRNGAIISQRVIRTSNHGDNVDFDQQALTPHASRMTLYHPKLPWYVDIHQSNPTGVTLQDVLVQLSSQMRTRIRTRHYYNDSLNDSARTALGLRYIARTEGREREGERGIVQVDFLGEKFVMEGLVRGNKGLWEIKTRKKY